MAIMLQSSMRTHPGGQLSVDDQGREVLLCGWVHRRRDHGGVIFVDLRDYSGLVQVVFAPEQQAAFQTAESLRGEFVVQVRGMVRMRSAETVNPAMATGSIEVVAAAVELLNAARFLPFLPSSHDQVSEEIRLRYRYLDLRRSGLQEQLQFRSRALSVICNHLAAQGFIHVETPILTRATPEGARDYLVPSRTRPGEAFALPQSPQLFKQCLMAGGVERYYQIARCFRDEDLRADRQPEFTQIDLEASFMEQQEIMALAEGLLRQLFDSLLGEDPGSFACLDHAQAMDRYGSDRPDLRIPLSLVEVGDLFVDSSFKVFRVPATDQDSRVAALHLPGGATMTRRELDLCQDYVSGFGAKGLAWIRIQDRKAGLSGLQSPILKFVEPEAVEQLLTRLAAVDGDLIFFGAGKRALVNESLGALRERLGAERKLIAEGWAGAWITDFPLFKEDARREWSSYHHPFTAPSCDLETLMRDPGAATSMAYDVVLNGVELGGGSLRIHDVATQLAVLQLLGMDEHEARQRFGFLLDALQSGCPPHGGWAMGLDRIVMIMTGAESLREVIAFPKTQNASCLLTSAPGGVAQEQWAELKLRSLIKPGAGER